jgi:hypothetical protein
MGSCWLSKIRRLNSACRGLFILLDYAWCGVEYPSLMILQPTYWDGFSSYSALRFVGRAVKWTIKFNSATIMLCECGRDPGVEPSKNAVGVTCAYCVQKMVAPPDYPKASSALSFEEKQAKKKAKAEKKTARLEAAKTAVRGRLRGWHKKELFEHEGIFYSFGKEINPSSAAHLKRTIINRDDTAKKTPTKTDGKGRGWHLKKVFTYAGKFYSFGKEVSEKEFKKLSKE